MTRAILLVMDSFGIGAAPDAAEFGDAGADTYGHIAAATASGKADGEGRKGPLRLPNLHRLGLDGAHALAAGNGSEHLPPVTIEGLYGAAAERSRGKDTPSGHWEMAGVPVTFEWGYFPPEAPSFPKVLTDALIDRAKLPGLLGNRHASGTTIIEELGDLHVATGKPIVYTSADSVFQIAAHESHFGLERLYDVCAIARRLVDDYDIGRVIARPFTGESGHYVRTANRRDLAVPPPEPTLLDRLEAAGREVVSIGKIGDIFAHKGTGRIVKADGNMALFEATLAALDKLDDGGLLFTNFVDFDMLYGHRRNVAGYAAALEAFDRRLPELEARLRPGDLVVISADHGCDPTTSGSDHTREFVPILGFGPAVTAGRSVGRRDSFADIGQSLAGHLGIAPLAHGESFL
ncbi:phosphopentomutase [Oceanibacterium hippocampi]|uniref:Phosphopentomutase n=1 Tax=Oceanibacterium hippocampi TaxID=745714 RepID=A0A1Y5U262_9PROT|nr:phosphopentomutase [Oceanibacterium hippocampi]SLN74758.1 Phosphopentomutase [Oceanibacterium hippocampi]